MMDLATKVADLVAVSELFWLGEKIVCHQVRVACCFLMLLKFECMFLCACLDKD